MAKGKTEKPKIELPEVRLLFATRPSKTTRDVRLVIPPGKIWHVSRREDGIYLVDRTKTKGERDTYCISGLPDEAVSKDTAFKIMPRNGAFEIQYTRGMFEYAHNDSSYVSLPYAIDFMEKGEHKFRCGSLEFTLELKDDIPQPLQLSTG